MSVAALFYASEAHRAQTVESRRRRPPPGCRKALPPRRKPLYEPLEPRLLLASDRFSFLAAPDVPIDLTLRLDHATQILQLIDQHEQVLASKALAETGRECHHQVGHEDQPAVPEHRALQDRNPLPLTRVPTPKAVGPKL